MTRKPGRLTTSQRREAVAILWDRQNGRCIWCEREMARGERGKELPGPHIATIEHMTPVAEGGTGEVANLALACRRCNEQRNTTTAEEWSETVEAIKAVSRKEPSVGTMAHLFARLLAKE